MSFSPWAAVGGLIVVLSLWSADRSHLTRDAAIESAKVMHSRWDELADDYAYLKADLENRTELQRQLTDISRLTQQLNSALDGQSALINRNFAEMKRNDKAVADYLDGLVPVALGLRYARPETTDPASWRGAAAASSVQLDAVPASGTAAAGSH
ncbi:hypothetical protein HBO06_25165 [Pseudomonas proteolytica]|nr:hypothetical protein [Pseudomonas proteolytica]NMZ37066.1 hypothetical protein [Pseudomonas proteolytica]